MIVHITLLGAYLSPTKSLLSRWFSFSRLVEYGQVPWRVFIFLPTGCLCIQLEPSPCCRIFGIKGANKQIELKRPIAGPIV